MSVLSSCVVTHYSCVPLHDFEHVYSYLMDQISVLVTHMFLFSSWNSFVARTSRRDVPLLSDLSRGMAIDLYIWDLHSLSFELSIKRCKSLHSYSQGLWIRGVCIVAQLLSSLHSLSNISQ